ncbi:MAG: hemerythrin family protein [Nitrospirae bacterium]|nr:hemerythrin family protein [Nitrospirota bacterium]
MSLIWTAGMATGVEVIDNQHRELFNRINALYDSCNNGRSKEEGMKLFSFVDNYIVNHFETEESLQKQYNYPEYPSHHTAHLKFKNDFNELRQAVDTSGITFHSILLTSELLSDWWIQHVTKIDKELGKFIKEKMR